jgi:hypothetical protein
VFVVGVDLGKLRDFTAVAVIEREERPGEKPLLYLRHLERYVLGTSYSEQMDRVAALCQRLQDLTQVPAVIPRHTQPGVRPELIVDATGVGEGVVEMLGQRRLQDGESLRYRAVTITGIGEPTATAGRRFTVPKQELVSRLLGPFESDRLKIAAGMALVDELVGELTNFRAKFKRPDSAHVSYEAWRESDHDDLVLAAALAAWWVERRRLVGVADKPKGW